MYTFDIDKYLNHYVRNAKRIAVRNFRYTSKDGALSKNKGYNDFDLLFNNKGQLLDVIDTHNILVYSKEMY